MNNNKQQARVLRAMLTHLFPKLRHFYLDTRSCRSIYLPGKAWRANYQGRHFPPNAIAKFKAIPGFLDFHGYSTPGCWPSDHHHRGTWVFFSKDVVRHFEIPAKPKVEHLVFVVDLTIENRDQTITQLKKHMAAGLSLIRKVKSVSVKRW